jgi:hypothetical protein
MRNKEDRMKNRVEYAVKVSALAVALLALASPAVSQEDPNDATSECVAACREAHRDCRFDSREGLKLCLEEAGCDLLRDDYRAVCLAEERDDEACAAARDALRACVEPCRDAAQADGEACREATGACLSEQCGIEKPERPTRPHRPGRHHGRHPFR